jgi:outer membrane PBP1 activator LpoA protein
MTIPPMTILSARLIMPALLALAVSGCANLGTQVAPGLPTSAKYPKDQAVVLLLPISAEGRLGAAVDAIEAGYAAALGRDPANNRKPETKDTSGDALAAYQSAAGTSPPPLIIGPLLKNNVNAIAEARSDTSPAMLALNQADQTSAGMVQFALAPEEEARTAAELINALAASQAGSVSTAIVYPQADSWGERMRAAFVGSLDKAPVAEVAYAGGQVGDLGDRVAGADIVFMVARPDAAAGVYAGLGGSGAGRPIIATSHATDTKADAAEKEGLFYVDVPWLVNREMAREFIARSPDTPDSDYTSGEMGRLYAMGIDAYYLGALVADAGDSTAITLPAGMTGDLSFTTTGRLLRRRLDLGRMGENGVTGPATVEELAAAVELGSMAQAEDTETDAG